MLCYRGTRRFPPGAQPYLPGAIIRDTDAMFRLANHTTASPRLTKDIGLLAAIALMLRNSIGTVVFLKARGMICNVGTPGMVLLSYVVAGLFPLHTWTITATEGRWA